MNTIRWASKADGSGSPRSQGSPGCRSGSNSFINRRARSFISSGTPSLRAATFSRSFLRRKGKLSFSYNVRELALTLQVCISMLPEICPRYLLGVSSEYPLASLGRHGDVLQRSERNNSRHGDLVNILWSGPCAMTGSMKERVQRGKGWYPSYQRSVSKVKVMSRLESKSLFQYWTVR